MQTISGIFCTALLMGLCGAGYAQISPATQSRVAAPIHKQIIEEIVHAFTVQAYVPELALVEKDASPNATSSPEDLLASWALAMRTKGYDSVMNHWDASSRQSMQSLDRASGKKPSDWEREWKRLFEGNKLFITHQIKYGPYVLFAIQIRNASNQPVTTDTLVLHNRDGRWLLTYDLGNSVVLTNWNSNQVRVQRLAAPLFKRVESR